MSTAACLASAFPASVVLGRNPFEPFYQRICEVGDHLRIRASTTFRHVKRMIGIVEQFKRRARAERSASACSNCRSASSSRVPCRNSIGICTSRRCAARSSDGLPGRMQRKSEEREAAYVRRAATRPAPARSCARRRICRRRKAGSRERRRAASATAARTAACASLGESGRFEPAPCTETDSAASRCRARRVLRRYSAMNGCAMPAPAPCAIT